MSDTTVRCGTNSGYMRHRQQGEASCADCRAAHNAYERERTRQKRAERKRQMEAEDRIWGGVA